MLRRNIIMFPSNWQHIINIHVLPLSPAQTHMNAYELLQSHSVLQKKNINNLCHSSVSAAQNMSKH